MVQQDSSNKKTREYKEQVDTGCAQKYCLAGQFPYDGFRQRNFAKPIQCNDQDRQPPESVQGRNSARCVCNRQVAHEIIKKMLNLRFAEEKLVWEKVQASDPLERLACCRQFPTRINLAITSVVGLLAAKFRLELPWTIPLALPTSSGQVKQLKALP